MKDDPSIANAAPPGAAGTPPQADGAGDAARHDQRLGFVHRLAAVGMEMLRALVASARARSPGSGAATRSGDAAGGLADRFGRIAKAVRVAILLRRRLADAGPGALGLGPTDRRAAPALGAAQAAVPADAAERLFAQPDLDPRDPAEQDGLARRPRRDVEARPGDTWLDRSDEAELRRRSVPTLVRRLCAILEIPFDAALWAEAGVRRLGARAPAPRPSPKEAARLPAAAPLTGAEASAAGLRRGPRARPSIPRRSAPSGSPAIPGAAPTLARPSG